MNFNLIAFSMQYKAIYQQQKELLTDLFNFCWHLFEVIQKVVQLFDRAVRLSENELINTFILPAVTICQVNFIGSSLYWLPFHFLLAFIRALLLTTLLVYLFNIKLRYYIYVSFKSFFIFIMKKIQIHAWTHAHSHINIYTGQ